MDISGCRADVRIRVDANNFVTAAQSAHLPEQKETIHMIQMLRKEATSGSIEDLAHVRTDYCLGDCLTKQSAKSDALRKAVDTGTLTDVDMHLAFRSLLQHKAFMLEWVRLHLDPSAMFSYMPGYKMWT